MKKSKWQEWIDSQPVEVKQEILLNNPSTLQFRDYNTKPISLEELEKLDDTYNL